MNIRPKPETVAAGDNAIELTVLMPCLNEAETLEVCIRKAQKCLQGLDVLGEVIVADNGSSDGSQQIAEQCGARIVSVSERGYGAALAGGIAQARGRFIIMGDADDSYDFSALEPFLHKLREGYDLVMGNRFAGGIQPGAMPALHYYFGNPVLSFIGRLFFRSGIRDFQCGLRGFRKTAVMRMDLRTTGMEFASEMVVKATLGNFKVTEVPTTLSPDGRSRPPHLRSWRDGWRNLRFLLLYSPRWLFLIPGIILMLLGASGVLALVTGPVHLGAVELDIHTMLYAAIAVILGFQAILFAVLTKLFAIDQRLLPPDVKFERLLSWFTLEKGLVAGVTLTLGGLISAIIATSTWGAGGFGELDPSKMMRIVIVSALLLTLGVQLSLNSFYVSILRMNRR